MSRTDYLLNGAIYAPKGPCGGPFFLIPFSSDLPMERVAVFVDAGYLFAAGSHLVAGQTLPRGEIVLEYDKVIESLSQFAERVSGAKLLRVYWYDGTSTGPTAQHISLAFLASVKMRLGIVNSMGQQKGVDSLVITDMIALARNRAMTEAVLLSGDEDLRVGVQQAQEFGVRVHLLGIEPHRRNQSLLLLQEADSTHEWTKSELTSFLSCSPKPDAMPVVAVLAPAAQNSEEAQLSAVGITVANEVLAGDLDGIIQTYHANKQIPQSFDGRLLGMSRSALSSQLEAAQKRSVRAAFIKACENRRDALAISKL